MSALDEQADAEFDRLEELVNQPPRMVDGKVDHAWVRLLDVQATNLRWSLAKMHPKKYSERVGMEVTGAEGSPFIPATGQPTDRDIFEAARRVAFILARADNLKSQQASPQQLPAAMPALPAPKPRKVVRSRDGEEWLPVIEPEE